ncbi:DNA damage-inducible protein I [Erwinia sp. OLTSP20]|uniref:DNA damage-inducible protein I n=1 Tax=unclassified Erwinia TaxID=2622719 RepID=UPI000C1A3A3A|nr:MULTISPECIES: DNA damage-inducible protein I [unclassified Erwinia]PIJ74783.1 DNA damage-inducible protein I [Erwinia sp. OLSSP12]PIJ85169.1 DNA damage-inducible protein I [Erwinia sp. OLCASP19]PIJ87170.1 DNA damage-inducible protein I [Erwinia sp. OLMTSP26]PIJ88314.1 DNA damage-inducible protein I [Erwinia sp. OLMDSP33]PIJ90408.1 DNA damage-inducible protein I [Erwinia sp. OLFS4]
MRIEITVAKTSPLPDGAMSALSAELSRRINECFPDSTSSVSLRYASSNNLTVMGADKQTRDQISHILQETWESADDWFCAG